MDQTILCVTAGQRSGTTALRNLISGTDRFRDLGEIFDTSTMDLPESFFGYARRTGLKVTDVMSGPDAERLCMDYIQLLRAEAGGKHLLIDVKFNSWGEIRMPWTYLHQEPFFLTQLKWRQAKFLFLWRRDIVAQVLSDRISDRIGKWHNLEAEDGAQPFTLDVARLTNRARLLCLSEGYFYDNIRQYPGAAVLCYEALFEPGGGFTEATAQTIRDLMGEAYVFPTENAYFKNRIDKARVLENYRELAQAIGAVIAQHRHPDLKALAAAQATQS